jgi:hypothetical protein
MRDCTIVWVDERLVVVVAMIVVVVVLVELTNVVVVEVVESEVVVISVDVVYSQSVYELGTDCTEEVVVVSEMMSVDDMVTMRLDTLVLIVVVVVDMSSVLRVVLTNVYGISISIVLNVQRQRCLFRCLYMSILLYLWR